MALDTVGSIAVHVQNSFNNIPAGVSGTMIDIVDLARQHVSNYVGETINGSSIDLKFSPAIVDFSKADTLDLIQSQGGGQKISLDELSIDESQNTLTAQQFRKMGEEKLKALGMKRRFSKSLS